MQKEHQARLRTGFRGLLDRLTGRRRKTEARNEIETLSAQRSAYAERQELIAQRERANQEIRRKSSDTQARKAYVQRELQKDMQSLNLGQERHAESEREAFKQKRRTKKLQPKRIERDHHEPRPRY